MSSQDGFIPAHGGYRKLRSYQKAQIVFDATVFFCARFLDKRDRPPRTNDTSTTSKKEPKDLKVL